MHFTADSFMINNIIIRSIITTSIAFSLSKIFYRIIEQSELINERKTLYFFSYLLYFITSTSLATIIAINSKFIYGIIFLIMILLARITPYYGIGLLIGLASKNDLATIHVNALALATLIITAISHPSTEYYEIIINPKQKIKHREKIRNRQQNREGYLILREYLILIIGVMIGCFAPGR